MILGGIIVDLDSIGQAKKEFKNISDSFKAKFYSIFDEIEANGFDNLQSGKHFAYIEDGIWELRIKAPEGIARALYEIWDRKILPLSFFVKKEQKIDRNTIELAKKRRKGGGKE